MPVLSAKEVTSPNDLKGKQRPQPGKYHVFITHWDETCKEKDQLVVGFTVIDGTTPGQTAASCKRRCCSTTRTAKT